jgi:hypothetical protein
LIERYFQQIAEMISQCLFISISHLAYDRRSNYVGFLRGEIVFLNGSTLYVREYVNVETAIDRYMYSYHYQQADGSFVFRYDNAPHYPSLPTFPHHKHQGDEVNVLAVEAPELAMVLAEIESLLYYD